MNWLNKHKDEIIKLTIVSVLSLIIYNVLVGVFNWSVINIPLYLSESSSSFSDWWVAFGLWGEEKVSIEKSKFQILSASIAIFTAFIQLVFWGINRSIKQNRN